MTSGAINAQLMIGITDCARKISRKGAKETHHFEDSFASFASAIEVV